AAWQPRASRSSGSPTTTPRPPGSPTGSTGSATATWPASLRRRQVSHERYGQLGRPGRVTVAGGGGGGGLVVAGTGPAATDPPGRWPRAGPAAPGRCRADLGRQPRPVDLVVVAVGRRDARLRRHGRPPPRPRGAAPAQPGASILHRRRGRHFGRAVWTACLSAERQDLGTHRRDDDRELDDSDRPGRAPADR